jgi:hypothetical protein
MASPDTSFLPPAPSSAERPGVDEHEHPGGPADRSDSCFGYLREIERAVIEANLRDQEAEMPGWPAHREN